MCVEGSGVGDGGWGWGDGQLREFRTKRKCDTERGKATPMMFQFLDLDKVTERGKATPMMIQFLDLHKVTDARGGS